jgi:hypothetical protein
MRLARLAINRIYEFELRLWTRDGGRRSTGFDDEEVVEDREAAKLAFALCLRR